MKMPTKPYGQLYYEAKRLQVLKNLEQALKAYRDALEKKRDYLRRREA